METRKILKDDEENLLKVSSKEKEQEFKKIFHTKMLSEKAMMHTYEDLPNTLKLRSFIQVKNNLNEDGRPGKHLRLKEVKISL